MAGDGPQGPDMALQAMLAGQGRGPASGHVLFAFMNDNPQGFLQMLGEGSFQGILNKPIMAIGGAGGKGGGFLEKVFFGNMNLPGQTSVAEMANMNAGDVQAAALVDAGSNGSFVGAPAATPMSDNGSRMIDV